jgi:hypothetical protein
MLISTQFRIFSVPVSSLISVKHIKIRVFPVVLYGCETRFLTLTEDINEGY